MSNQGEFRSTFPSLSLPSRQSNFARFLPNPLTPHHRALLVKSNRWTCLRLRPLTWHEFLLEFLPSGTQTSFKSRAQHCPLFVSAVCVINERSLLDILNTFFITFSFINSGVHHKKNNCESNQVISKVQQVISVATKAGQLYPKNLMLTVASVIKKQKIRKGNGGWGDRRDVLLCLNMTLVTR